MTRSVSTSITLALVLVGGLLFGVHAVWQLQQEERDLRAAFQGATSLLGRSLQVGIENALRDRQMSDIQEILNELERIDPSLDIFVLDTQANLEAESADSDPTAILSMPLLLSPGASPRVQWNESIPGGRLFMAWSLADDNGTEAGTLIIARPLTELRADLAAMRRATMVTLVAFFFATTVLGVLLGHVFVRRPLRRVVRAMVMLREDGNTELLPTPGNEIGAVASEFNALVSALREANLRLAQETEAKLHLQQGLRRIDKLATLGQVSAGLAHEIGSPLQVLNGRARNLLTAAHDPDKVRKNAQILVSQTDRITRVVEQLLSFVRRRPVALTAVEMASAAGAVVDLLGLDARRRRIHLEFKAAPALPSVLADADQVQQIVLNLVSNALAATREGGTVSVSLSCSSLDDERACVQICIEDNGCGIEDEVRAELFQPFFTTRLSEGGTGLGLAVVKSIVAEHGGAIRVESARGRGSRFIVDLPVDGPPGARGMAS